MAATILIVDDEEHLRMLLRKLLANEGYRVIEADSGKSCLEMLHKEKPDLIIMDVMMPGMSGAEAAKNIRENSSIGDIRIVFLTVVAACELDREALEELKVGDYIEKPFDNEDFISRVKKALG